MNWKKQKRAEILISVILIILGMVFLVFAEDHTTIWFAIVRNLAAVGVIIIISENWKWIPIHHDILEYLTKISGEIYILHIPICAVLRFKLVSDTAYIAWVSVLTLLLSIIFYFIDRRVKWVIQKLFYTRYNSW